MYKIVNILSVAAVGVVLSQNVGAVQMSDGEMKTQNKKGSLSALQKSEKILADRKARAKEMVNKAIDLYKKEGPEAFAIIGMRGGDFCIKVSKHYTGVYITTTERDNLVSCTFPGLVGTNDIGWRSPGDQMDSPKVVAAAAAHPEGTFYTHMSNLDPYTGKPGVSSTYVREHDGMIFVAEAHHPMGSYRNLIAAEDIDLYTEE